MTVQVRRPLWLALAASLMLHMAALLAPGWALPDPGDADEPLLEARLVAPAPPPPLAQPVPPPLPRPVPAPVAKPLSAPVPLPPQPVENPMPVPVPVPVAAAETAPPALPAPPEPRVAVPPAPTCFEPAALQRWPRQGRLVFGVYRGEGGEHGLLVGESVHAWTHDGEQYELTVTTETVGLAALFRPVKVEQVSRGGFDAHGLMPASFEARRGGELKESIRFDHAQQRIFFGNGRSAPLRPGTQDLVALFHQLGAWRPDLDAVRVQIATGRKVAEYNVLLLGIETVVVPLNEFLARHFRITTDQGGDATELWVDNATGLPVRIRHRDRKGEVFDQFARELETKDLP